MVCVSVSLSVSLCVYVDIPSGAHRSEIILLFSNLVENIILSFFDLARVTTFIYNIHSSLSTLVILSYFRSSSSHIYLSLFLSLSLPLSLYDHQEM